MIDSGCAADDPGDPVSRQQDVAEQDCRRWTVT